MDNVNKNISIVEHILKYCQEISIMVKRFGDTFDEFNGDFAYKHACSMCILQIGELTAHLTDDFKQAYDDIPWRSIKAMRNVAAHAYGNMSIENTWATVSQDIPVLLSQCASILAQYKVCDQPALEIEQQLGEEELKR
jgi:uncharacterized protein with HEPN domain